MRLLSRHVSLTVLYAMLTVQLLLLGLDLLFSFIGEMEEVRGNYGVWEAFVHVLLVLPSHSFEILPMSALVGALVGLGTLASNSELTVMRAAGVSVARIVWWVMRAALVVIVLGVLMGEYVVPVTEHRAEVMKAKAQGRDYAAGKVSGFWQREGHEFYNIHAVSAEGELIGVSRYQFDEHQQLLSAQFAESGQFVGQGWQLYNTKTTELLADGRTQTQTLPSVRWSLQLTPEFLRVASAPTSQLQLGELLGYAQYLKVQGLDAGEYLLQFWKKVLSPLAVVSMMVVACSFIFGPLRSVTLGLRIITGVVVGLVFRYVQDAAGFASLLYDFSPMVAISLPILLTFALGGYALSRVR